MADLGYALDWDSTGEVQNSQFELLPEGEYDYEVVNLKHERYGGGDKMAACPVAALQLKCRGEKGTGIAFVRLYLNSKVLWRITSFFKSCGLIPVETAEGTKFPMTLFEDAVGCSGRCKVRITKSESKGKTYENNEVDFLMPRKVEPASIPAGGLFS